MTLDPELVRRAPKVLLHDHLDGGLRPATVAELAVEVDHPLPVTDTDALGRWFAETADSGSLPAYLETFDHTVAVMQTAPALRRVAREFVEDMVADGVVYAETRWAPSQHTARGLSLTEAVRAVQQGLDEGVAAADRAGHPIRVGQLLTALRHQDDSPEIAELAGSLRGEGVVGFDIAGPEAGFPPVDHLPALQRLKELNMKITIHAGEAFGPASIWQAVQRCGADRVGHGVRLVEDVTDGPDGPRVGELGGYLRDARIALELCPRSNVQTGAVASVAEHPIDLLTRLGLRTTVNTDNRLMSDTTLSKEFLGLGEAFGYGLDELRRFTLNAAKASFLDLDARRALITEVIVPGYAALGV
ncbi:adenosine deaminase [Friedmanniella endophytica]|uniref:adenosine deaminase n=1 Tax=Microlunatus kandeliicorticis TaxID=1759536 RepID=A0A7W3P4U5_9ACTN|nr:adenosine deaminase [Microlunatus kandeliicorticis]MBA8793274.1 adenosine deaminase [Microlunatus kandeliicorticis]